MREVAVQATRGSQLYELGLMSQTREGSASSASAPREAAPVWFSPQVESGRSASAPRPASGARRRSCPTRLERDRMSKNNIFGFAKNIKNTLGIIRHPTRYEQAIVIDGKKARLILRTDDELVHIRIESLKDNDPGRNMTMTIPQAAALRHFLIASVHGSANQRPVTMEISHIPNIAVTGEEE